MKDAKLEQAYKDALERYSAGDRAGARTLLQDVLLIDPNHLDARNDLGAIYCEEGRPELARIHFKAAVDGEPSNATYRDNLHVADEMISAMFPHAVATDEAVAPTVPRQQVQPSILPSTPQAAPVAINYAKLQHWERTIEGVTQKVSDTILQYLEPNGVFVDVGANVGLCTAQVLRQKSCRAYLFEPVPEYAAYTAQRFSGDSRVTVSPVALSTEPGFLELWLDDQNLGWNTIVSEKRIGNMVPTRVEAITFDDFAQKHGINRIDVMKIDVEGGEFAVLGGMRRTLSALNKKPVIICEIGWGPNSHPNWDKEVEAFEWLFANGYERFDYNVSGTRDVVILPKPVTRAEVPASESKPATKSAQQAPTALPRVTLGVPTRNRIDPLVQLLQSVQRQTFQNFELIISDDGDRYDIAAEIQHQVPGLQFRHIRGPQKNLPANRQNILDAARTELVIMCDDDHIMKDDCLEQLVTTMCSDDSYGIVSAIWPHPLENPRTINFDEVSADPEFRLDLDNIGTGSDFWWKNGTETFKAFSDRPRLIDSQFSGGGCLIYRKTAVQLAGGFPHNMSVVSFREDTDMSHRVYLAGYRIAVNPQAIAFHMCAPQGGCRDTRDWEGNFVRDGLQFIERLRVWRSKSADLDRLKRQHLPVRVAMFYDEKGWAWWNRIQNVKKFIGPDFVIDPIKLATPFRHDGYDIVFAFDYNVLREIPPVPATKLVIGNSCPKLIDGAIELLEAGKCAAVVINNLQTYIPHRHRKNVFCCQNGVDLDLFYPAPQFPSEVIACWTGNSASIGNKGLDLIQEACRLEGVKLEILDVSEKPKDVEAQPQSYVRDALYHKGSVYICASQWEGTPNPALESLACGLPVITTGVGNMPEIITDGFNGYIVERSVEGIREALRKYKIADRAKLSRNARATMEQGWGWHAQVKKYQAVFLELARQRFFGDVVERQISDAEVDTVRRERMSQEKRRVTIEDFVEKRDGRFVYVSQRLVDGLIGPDGIEQAAHAIGGLGPMFFHFGGAGDALLLLSTFYDIDPRQVIVSVGNPQTMRAFFDAFPELKEVYLIPFPERHECAALVRLLASVLPNCLGRGATPAKAHAEEWHRGINPFETYKIQLRPKWAQTFRAHREESFQVILHPKGSEMDMVGGKRNVIDSPMWSRLIQMLTQHGIRPIIIGTPEDRATYPALPGSIDRRSYSFSEQMTLVASSDLVVSADSWAKTFSALLGIPTCVFPPIGSGGYRFEDDASANVFLHPWPSIALTPSLDALLRYLPTPNHLPA